MPGQITQVRTAGSLVYLTAEFPGVATTQVRHRAINTDELVQSKDPAAYLACEIEMAMLDPKPETSNVD